MFFLTPVFIQMEKLNVEEGKHKPDPWGPSVFSQALQQSRRPDGLSPLGSHVHLCRLGTAQLSGILFTP